MFINQWIEREHQALATRAELGTVPQLFVLCTNRSNALDAPERPAWIRRISG